MRRFPTLGSGSCYRCSQMPTNTSGGERWRVQNRGLLLLTAMGSTTTVEGVSEPFTAPSAPTVGEGSAGAGVVGRQDATTVASSGIIPQTSRQTSTAWNDFDRFKDVDGICHARCKHCGKEYLCDSNKHGTSTLHLHVKSCPKHPKRLDPTQQALTFRHVGKGADGQQLVPWHFNQKASKSALFRMIIMDELPFSFVCGDGFQQFLAEVCPMFVCPTRYTVRRGFFKLYEAEKLKLHECFSKSTPRISLTTDTWTSVQQINYMCLTAHFIDDDWVIHKKIINFCPITSHRGEDIGKAIEYCLNSWGLDRIMTITVDNASANDTALRYLNRQQSLLCNSVLDGKYMHMRCIAHILNLVVSDGLGQLGGDSVSRRALEGLGKTGKSVERIRYAVRFVKSSPMRLTRFKLACIQAGYATKRLLSLDVPTRWNATYLMLKSASRLENAFPIYNALDPVLNVEMDSKVLKDGTFLGRLEDEDWEVCKYVMSFLELFYEVTVRVSGSSYATSNLILDEISEIYTFIGEGLASDNVEMRNMAMKMGEKFNKYFGDMEKLNLFTFIAPMLDPQKKLDYVTYLIESMYPEPAANILVPLVTKFLNDLYAQYVREAGPSDDSETEPVITAGSAAEKPSKYQKFAAYKRQKTLEAGVVKNELEQYLFDAEEADCKDFKVLTWWKDNKHRYPTVAKMARDILAIPVSTVPSESAFSKGSRVLGDFKSTLSTHIVHALICTEDWLKNIPALFSTAELELEMDALQIVDDDLGESCSPIGNPLIF